MKCQYCGAEIKEDALFCDSCGQAVDATNGTKQNMDAFWQKENNQKQKEVVEQIAGLKGKCEQIQGAIFCGKKLKSRKHFSELCFCCLYFVLAYWLMRFTGLMKMQASRSLACASLRHSL